MKEDLSALSTTWAEMVRSKPSMALQGWVTPSRIASRVVAMAARL